MEYNKMIEIILEEKKELNFEKLKELIEEKKRKIGAGYLTDQGALFLIAADLGVSLDKASKTENNIKDLFVGARDIVTVGRIISIHPTRIFMKKDTNQEAKNRIIVIYDKESSIRIKLWDELSEIPDHMDIRKGDLIRITKGQVKSGMDGKPIINLSGNSTIERLDENNNPDIPKLEEIMLTIDKLDIPKDNLVISGYVSSDPRISEFTNFRGEHSKSLQLELTDEKKTRRIRTILWNINENKIPKSLSVDTKIELYGVKTKIGNPSFGNGDIEIHGDEGSIIEVIGQEETIDSYEFRIVSVNENQDEEKLICVGVDKNNKTFFINIDKSLFDIEINQDDIIECFPNRILGNNIEVTGQDSYIHKVDEERNIPYSSELDIKIKNIESANKLFFGEAIILQNPNTTDITTKSGETVMVTETIIGDDTGEIRLTAWRDASKLLRNFSIGERIKINAVLVTSGKDGKNELTLKPYSNIFKLS